eukprot:s2451_g8.t1
MSSSVGYLDQIIQAEEDPRLMGSHQHADAVPTTIQRPPGVSTLRQWGQLIIPSGKHAGKSFEEAHKDLGYVHQIWNRRAVSGWLRSFQMYCRQRQKVDPELDPRFSTTMPVSRVIPPAPLSPEVPRRTTTVPKAKSHATAGPSHPTTSEGWTQIEETSNAEPVNPRQPKRAIQAATSSSRMSTETNQDRVQQIQTQIAILERELAREMAVPEDGDEEKIK